MNRKLIWLFAVSLVLVVALAGCLNASDSEVSEDRANAASDAASGESPVTDPGGDPIPEDIPVMAGAYNLDVIRDGARVSYTVDQDIDAVISYYQTELESVGWISTRTPDSGVGAMGTMSRENEAGDKLSINMSYNAGGGFTVISISVLRAP